MILVGFSFHVFSVSPAKANLLYAESLLYMDGPDPVGESPHLAAQGLQMTRRVPQEVLAALERTWPLEIATRRYQERAERRKETRLSELLDVV